MQLYIRISKVSRRKMSGSVRHTVNRKKHQTCFNLLTSSITVYNYRKPSLYTKTQLSLIAK